MFERFERFELFELFEPFERFEPGSKVWEPAGKTHVPTVSLNGPRDPASAPRLRPSVLDRELGGDLPRDQELGAS